MNENIIEGNIPKNLKLAGPTIEVILPYLPNIFTLKTKTSKSNKHRGTRQAKSHI